MGLCLAFFFCQTCRDDLIHSIGRSSNEGSDCVIRLQTLFTYWDFFWTLDIFICAHQLLCISALPFGNRVLASNISAFFCCEIANISANYLIYF
jgi:hypothetical protein